MWVSSVPKKKKHVFPSRPSSKPSQRRFLEVFFNTLVAKINTKPTSWSLIDTKKHPKKKKKKLLNQRKKKKKKKKKQSAVALPQLLLQPRRHSRGCPAVGLRLCSFRRARGPGERGERRVSLWGWKHPPKPKWQPPKKEENLAWAT